MRERREALGLTQDELAERAGISRPYLSDLEQDKRKRPGKERLDALAKALGIPSLTEPNGRNYRSLPDPPASRDLRPGYAYAACGDPRNPEDAPSEIGLRPVPSGLEDLLGPNSFYVVVDGNSMAGANIRNGNIAWVNPDERPRSRRPVLARIRRDDGEYGGMIIKRFVPNGGERGEDCLQSDPGDGTKEAVECGEFQIIGAVKWIEEGRPPT